MDGLNSVALAPVLVTPMRIAVLLGGDSAERAVSLDSGNAVATALRARGHKITLVDPSSQSLETFNWSQVDVAFLALHGTFGEDGTAQAILEESQVAFTGSDSVASRLAFSKSAAKERFLLRQVNTPNYLLIHASDPSDQIQLSARNLGFPLVAKPDGQGSSIGVSIIANESQLAEGIAGCFEHQPFGLLEKAITGPEWTVGVIDTDPLPPICIGTNRSFYDYEAKYNADDTQYEFDIADELKNRLQATAISACQALGTTGVARVDIMLDQDEVPWVLEVNTIPGMTSHSLIPKAAAEIDLDMGQLCELIIDRTLKASRRMRHAS
jgi:D-alanine-D-alanine ligase